MRMTEGLRTNERAWIPRKKVRLKTSKGLNNNDRRWFAELLMNATEWVRRAQSSREDPGWSIIRMEKFHGAIDRERRRAEARYRTILLGLRSQEKRITGSR